MSIRVEQLVFAEDSDTTYLSKQGDIDPNLPDVLSMVRHIFRDRSDITQMPVINGVSATTEPNQWGHNIFIDVTYSTRGWRATYAARRTDSGISKFTCYMD